MKLTAESRLYRKQIIEIMPIYSKPNETEILAYSIEKAMMGMNINLANMIFEIAKKNNV